MNYVKPIIERFGEDILIDNDRKDAADAICRYLSDRRNQDRQHEYYKAVESLLRNRDSERIVLYLPFDELVDSPKTFKEAYLGSWYKLLNVHDARENFHEGDTFEPDARLNGEVERVVKCAHLTPWLIRAGYINYCELLDILHHYSDDGVLLQSFKDTWAYIRDNNLLNEDEISKLHSATSKLPLRKKPRPLYISKKRIEWLKERDEQPRQLLTPDAHLEGPFSPNLKVMCEKIKMIEANLKPNEIVLLGGSQLKGYGTVDSDLDIWFLKELEKDPMLYPGSPHAAHIYFNAIWIGGKSVNDLAKTAKEKLSIYIGGDSQRLFLERLEGDLLQYRLLHKGFSRFTGKKQFGTGVYLEMDGDCPFYDDKYRRIATMLYAKYVLIPKEESFI